MNTKLAVKIVLAVTLVTGYWSLLTAQQQGVSVQAAADKQTVTIGDPVVLDVTLTSPANLQTSLPEKTAELGPWSVLDVRTKEDKGPERTVRHFSYTLSAFTTGQVVIPEIAFKYKNAAGEEKEVRTAPVPVTVESVLAKYGEQGGIRDVKPPLGLRIPASTYALWFLLIALPLAGLYFWYLQYQKRNAAAFPAPAVPARPPYEVALEELQKLKNSDLIKEGRIKEFYIALGDIVRDYLAPVYMVETRDKTTAEIYQQLRQSVSDKKIVGRIKDFFDECDLVKFAKYRPEESVCLQDWEAAKSIVDLPGPVLKQ